MIRVVLWIVAGIAALAVVGTVALAIWARVAPETAADWHVDPMTAARAASPNTALAAPEGAAAGPAEFTPPVWDVPPERLMEIVEQVAGSWPRTEMIAGSAEDLHATWRTRSAVMGWPDFVSVRVLPVEGGSTVAIYSRSRFGESDFGVNKARVSAWLTRIGELAEG